MEKNILEIHKSSLCFITCLHRFFIHFHVSHIITHVFFANYAIFRVLARKFGGKIK